MKLFYVVRYQGPATTRWPASYKSLPVHLKGGENSQIAHFLQTMLQFTTVLKICRDLLFFGYLRLAKLSFLWYSI